MRITGTKKMFYQLLSVLFLCCSSADMEGQTKNVLGVKGTRFVLNEEPFEYTGVSFFNAIYNDEFNQSSEKRKEWIGRFSDNGINVLTKSSWYLVVGNVTFVKG